VLFDPIQSPVAIGKNSESKVKRIQKSAVELIFPVHELIKKLTGKIAIIPV